MILLRNPFDGLSDYNCFACAPSNSVGLRLRFYLDGNRILCRWKPRQEYQGYGDIVHGGIQATLADEAASWAIFAILHTAGVTKSIEMEYLKPLHITDNTITISASIESKDRKEASVVANLYYDSADILSRAHCVYRIFSQRLAEKRLRYPGARAFFDSDADYSHACAAALNNA